MKTGKWNLIDQTYAEIRVYCIYCRLTDFEMENHHNDVKLLLLSHQFSYREIPTHFSRKFPSYISSSNSQTSIIVFDVFSKFQISDIPDWASFDEYFWDGSAYFSNEIVNHFRRAMVLFLNYKFVGFKPLYFSAYILVTDYDEYSEPFILTYVPILKSGQICLRVIIQSSLNFIIQRIFPPKIGTYVLIPPYEHPFIVVDSENDIVSLKYIDHTRKEINWSKCVHVSMVSPNLSIRKHFIENATSSLHMAKQLKNDINMTKKPFYHFATKNYLEFPPENIEMFLNSKKEFNNSFNDRSAEQKNYEIGFPEMTPIQIAHELISDFQERDLILEQISINGLFPSQRCSPRFFIASFLSFFRFDFGFCSSSPPKVISNLPSFTSMKYEHLGIPQVVVNKDGAEVLIDASQIIQQWEDKVIQPICGTKNAHFVVFFDSAFKESQISTFFSMLSHNYSLLGFGKLIPYPKANPYISVLENIVPDTINSFFKEHSLSEFQQDPLLSFIVGQPIYDSGFLPHTILSYIRPKMVSKATEMDFKTLSFVVYSRIRLFVPRPYGMINISTNESASIFFGFRYQPPFLLKRNHDHISIHVSWDMKTDLTAWLDDIGSILHVLPVQSLSRIFELMKNAQDFLKGIDIRFTLSVLSEGISKQTYDQIMYEARLIKEKLTLFTIFPTSSIQCVLSEQCDDDIIVFDTMEQTYELERHNYMKPEESCYVLSKHKPSYTVSLYTGDAWTNSRNILTDQVRGWSHLSWLSVKPGSEKRTISYPPHIAALLRKCHPETDIMCKFEFLPQNERI